MGGGSIGDRRNRPYRFSRPVRSIGVRPGRLLGPCPGSAGMPVVFAIPGGQRATWLFDLPSCDRAAPSGCPGSPIIGSSRACRSRRSPLAFVACRRRSRRASMTRQVRRPGRSRPASSGCAAAAAPTPSRATARATPTHTASAAIPARSSGAGLASGCSMRCARGATCTGSCRRHTTGRARTRAGAGRDAQAPGARGMASPERRHSAVRDVDGRTRGGLARRLVAGMGLTVHKPRKMRCS